MHKSYKLSNIMHVCITQSYVRQWSHEVIIVFIVTVQLISEIMCAGL